MQPFWPRRSPHFLACRQAVRPFDGPAVIGLSGGPDSLALVAAAAAEQKDVSVMVVDHGLQPGSADVAERAAAVADEQAERDAAHAAGPVAQKKERGRSENLDPEIEA